MNTVSSWLEKIEQYHPQTIALGLERVKKVGQKLDVVDFTCPVVMVGGTNGKGSCVKFLETILDQSNFRVGAYTSPHLLRFNERIRLNNTEISDDALLEAFEAVESARNAVDLTFFEFTTLAALWLFKQNTLDIILLEVGLGGRLDAVNIVDADIAVITSVSIDHTDWLGETQEQIGWEKAGIFKKNRKAIIGDADPPKTIFDKARQEQTDLYCLGKDFSYEVLPDFWSWVSPKKSYHHLPLPRLPIQSAATSLMVLTLVSEYFPIAEEQVQKAMIDASLTGRFQSINQPYSGILDVAHNEESARLLAKRCQAFDGNLIAVVGMLADKDIANTLRPVVGLVKEWYVGSLNVSRGAKSTQLAKVLENIDNHKCYTYDCVTKAFDAAGAKLLDQQKLLIFGSFYTVAEILQHISKE